MERDRGSTQKIATFSFKQSPEIPQSVRSSYIYKRNRIIYTCCEAYGIFLLVYHHYTANFPFRFCPTSPLTLSPPIFTYRCIALSLCLFLSYFAYPKQASGIDLVLITCERHIHFKQSNSTRAKTVCYCTLTAQMINDKRFFFVQTHKKPHSLNEITEIVVTRCWLKNWQQTSIVIVPKKTRVSLSPEYLLWQAYMQFFSMVTFKFYGFYSKYEKFSGIPSRYLSERLQKTTFFPFQTRILSLQSTFLCFIHLAIHACEQGTWNKKSTSVVLYNCIAVIAD